MADTTTGVIVTILALALIGGYVATSTSPVGATISSFAIPSVAPMHESMFVIQLPPGTTGNMTVGVYPIFPDGQTQYWTTTLQSDSGATDISSPLEGNPTERAYVNPADANSVAAATALVPYYTSFPIAQLTNENANLGITYPVVLTPNPDGYTEFTVLIISDHEYLGGVLMLGNSTYQLPVPS